MFMQTASSSPMACHLLVVVDLLKATQHRFLPVLVTNGMTPVQMYCISTLTMAQINFG
jgi:hypothetical protein